MITPEKLINLQVIDFEVCEEHIQPTYQYQGQTVIINTATIKNDQH